MNPDRVIIRAFEGLVKPCGKTYKVFHNPVEKPVEIVEKPVENFMGSL